MASRSFTDQYRASAAPRPAIITIHHPIATNLSAAYHELEEDAFQTGRKLAACALLATITMCGFMGIGYQAVGFITGCIAAAYWGAAGLAAYNGFWFQRLALCDRMVPVVRADDSRVREGRG